MIAHIHRISKAVGAAVPGLAVFVTDVSLQTADVTADGTILQNEWWALGFAVVSGISAWLAPANAPSA